MEKNSTHRLHIPVKFSGERSQPADSGNKLSVPPQSLINNILNYSKALRVQKSANCGFVEFVAN
jgi:hypothetical protein